MTKALQVRILASGQLGGTHVYDAADGVELSNVVAIRFEHRVDHEPIVILELAGGALYVTEHVLSLTDTDGAGREDTP
jgi:hypothetical protein